MPTRLEQIMAAHRALVDERDVNVLLEKALASPRPRDFRGALQKPNLSLIAEIKRRSPSAGDLNLNLDPAAVARSYASGGASCLSVLTDREFFGGSTEDLQTASAAVDVPVLRKDFTIDERDVLDARLMGADAVLLIVAGLSDDELFRFGALARRLSLTALFEVHDQDEVRRALKAGATVVGINQRNLHTFAIDPELAVSMVGQLPPEVIKVAESGIKTPGDIRRLAEAGFDAALVGTSLVTAGQTQDSVTALVEAGLVSDLD